TTKRGSLRCFPVAFLARAPIWFTIQSAMSDENKSTMDSFKDAISSSVESTKSSISALKEKFDEYDEAFKNKASEYFHSVQGNANESMEELKEYVSKPRSEGDADSVRDKLNKWGESLSDLESRASEYGGKFSEQVSEYVSKQ
ncbi:unnamed protein product, partial [Aphanomyces euteiches]